MIRAQIDNIKSVYDLMALCCQGILLENPEYDCLNMDFLQYTDGVKEIFDVYFAICREEAERTALEELKEDIKFFLSPKYNLHQLYAIIITIDDRVLPKVAGDNSIVKEIVPYISLNKQYYDTIRLFPQNVANFFDNVQREILNEQRYSPFRDSRDIHDCIFDYTIKNYIIWTKKMIDECPIEFFRVSKNGMLDTHFKNRDRISLYVSPLTCKGIEEVIDYTLEEHSFYVNGIKEGIFELLRKRCIEAEKKAEQNDIDFLVFPEMMMNDELIQEIQNGKNMGSPWVTIGGSVWKNKVNCTTVLDMNGDSFMHYNKKEPYLLKGRYWEHLDIAQNRGYAILEIDGLGRIGVGICKDLLNSEVKKIHKKLHTNILILPAYSKSSDVLSEISELSQQGGCIVLFANTCSAMNNEQRDQIGYLSLPAKSSQNSRSNTIISYSNKECFSECDKYCKGKVFRIYINQLEEENSKVSFKHCEESL